MTPCAPEGEPESDSVSADRYVFFFLFLKSKQAINDIYFGCILFSH